MTVRSVLLRHILTKIEGASCITLKQSYRNVKHRCLHTAFALHKSSQKGLKGRKGSSQQWLQRQFDDPYVKKARFESYRCRSAFKLIEIDEKHKLFSPGMTVIDCGAAPGSWSQVAVKKVNSLGEDKSVPQGCVISVDLQHMNALPGANVLSGRDFTKTSSQAEVQAILNSQLADVVISDMAPNATGVKSLDHEIIIELCLSVLKFAPVVLKDGGTVLCKIWQGQDQKMLTNKMENMFESVRLVKPLASRKDSAEMFLLGKTFRREGLNS